MASQPGWAQTSSNRRFLLFGSALLAGGAFLLGVGALLVFQDGGRPAGIFGLVCGTALALIGGRRIWRRAPVPNSLPADAAADPAAAPLPAFSAALPGPNGSILDLRQQMMQIQMQADQVRDIAQHIGQAAARHNHDATDQAQAMQQVAAATSELDQLVRQVAATAQVVARAADEVLTASAYSRKVVEDAVTSLSATEQRVSETMTALTGLRARAGQISAINEVIAEIADDTNLLALNATIEAAGAGASGRRFAVVASEVRTLASRAREEGQRVGQLIQEVETAMTATIQVATAGLQQTAHTSQLTGSLQTTATQLTDTAARMQQTAGAIEQATRRQETSAAAVAAALTNIADAAQGMRTQTLAITSEADDLIGVARQLREVALRFGISAPAHGRLRLQIAGRETVSSRGLAWTNLVESWNATHPDAVIAIEFVPPAGDYASGLAQALAAGTAADIVHIVHGTDLGRQGYLAPLEGLVSPSVWSDFYPGLLEADMVDGHLYSLPTEAQLLLLVYNRQLFTELHIPPPRTWDDLIAAGQRCRTEHRWGLILETNPGEFRAKQWLPFVWQGGGEIVDAAGRIALDTPPVQAALGLWRDLLVTHRLVPLKRPHPWYDIANLVEGHCAMQYIGSWALTMLQEQYPTFSYGVLPLPIPPGGRPVSLLMPWRLAVNAGSPHRETALAFVRWALAGEGAEGALRVRSLLVEGLPVRQSVVPLIDQKHAPDPLWRYSLEEIYPHSRIEGPWTDALAAELDAAMEQALQIVPVPRAVAVA